MIIPTMLDFEPAEMLAYAPETSIAEKAHAILERKLLNSRMKDFYDIWLFFNSLELDENGLIEAIVATFRVRRTSIDTYSIVFKDEFFHDDKKQKQWSAFLRKRHIDDAPRQFSDIASEVMVLLKPYLDRAAERQ